MLRCTIGEGPGFTDFINIIIIIIIINIIIYMMDCKAFFGGQKGFLAQQLDLFAIKRAVYTTR